MVGGGKGYLRNPVSNCQLCTCWERLYTAAWFLGRNDDVIWIGGEVYLDRIGSQDEERRGGWSCSCRGGQLGEKDF